MYTAVKNGISTSLENKNNLANLEHKTTIKQDLLIFVNWKIDIKNDT